MQRGVFREIEAVNENPDAEPVISCQAAKPAIIVYASASAPPSPYAPITTALSTTRAAARRAEHPEPVMPSAAPAETEEEAEARKQQHEQQRKEYEAEQERGLEEQCQQQEREEQSLQAEQFRREGQRKARAATFERILQNAPETLNATQLRVLLRSIVNLHPYTFAEDLAEDIADENDKCSPEEVLLATIDGTADSKLTHFAIRLALSGHTDIPRENELNFLTEADAVFAPPQQIAKVKKTRNAPVTMHKPKAQPKKTAAKKQAAA